MVDLKKIKDISSVGTADFFGTGMSAIFWFFLASQIEPNSKTFEHWDRCIQCRACEPACPSGVNYGLLIESAKSGMNEIKSKSFLYRFNFKIIINLSISTSFVRWNSLIFRISHKLTISKIIEN